MKSLKQRFEECISTELSVKPNGVYYVTDSLSLASVQNCLPIYLNPVPLEFIKDVQEDTKDQATEGMVSEGFALKALAMAMKRPTATLKVLAGGK